MAPGVWLTALTLLAWQPGLAAQTAGTRSAPVDVLTPASELPQLRSLLVSWRGELIAEYYARGVRPNRQPT